MTVAALRTAVEARIGPERLKNLTNDDIGATTVNTTVLEAACADAIGLFLYLSGFEGDTSNATHLAILIDGVVFKLEDYKGRDGGIVSSRRKQFTGECLRLREQTRIDPGTSGHLEPSTELRGSRPIRPDMDRNLNLWGIGNQVKQPQEEIL